MLRAVTFDFWNTLVLDAHGREREKRRATVLAAELTAAGEQRPTGVIHEALQTGFDFFDRVWYAEYRTPDCAEIVDNVLDTLNVRLSPLAHTRVVEAFEEMILELPPDPMPGALAAIGALADRYRLAVVCDTGYSPGRVLREVLDRHLLLDSFDYLFFSDEHGMSKPDIRVFEHTLGELGVRAREAAHVGDIQRTDIAGAQAAGMAAVHFIGANQHDAKQSTADVVVSRLAELPGALEKLPRRRRWLGQSLSERLGGLGRD